MKLSPRLRPSGLSSELVSRGSQRPVSLPSTRITYPHHPVPPVHFPQPPLLPGVSVSHSHCLVPLLFRPLLLSLHLKHLFDNLIAAGETNALQFSANVIAGRCVIMPCSSSSPFPHSPFPTSHTHFPSPLSFKSAVRIQHLAAAFRVSPGTLPPRLRPFSPWRTRYTSRVLMV